MHMYEVILFCGPRYSGKTAYYRERFARTHARVSADDIYRKKPSANLHVVIKQFISTLKEKRLVVIDDQNWSLETRQSYLRAINKQQLVGGCRVSCVEFLPYHSKQQCMWTAQWALASQEARLIGQTRKTAHTINSFVSVAHCLDYTDTTNAIYRTFSTNPASKPHKAEGFTEVCSVESQLMCIRQYEFTIPALLIQWDCMVGVAGSAVVEACYHWQASNTTGRVIVVGNKQDIENGCKESVQLICNVMEEHPQLVLFYAVFAGTLSHMIAWLQYRHTIALYHPATVYVWSSESHCDCAKSLGIIQMNVDVISSQPKTITCVHHSTSDPPVMLRKFQYCCPDRVQNSGAVLDSGIFDDSNMSTWTSSDASRNDSKDTFQHYQLPLFELANQLNKRKGSFQGLLFDSKQKRCSIDAGSSGIGWFHVFTDIDGCYKHGLLYNSWTRLCQYQKDTQDVIVTVTNKDCSMCFMKKLSTDSSMGKEKKAVVSCLSSPFVATKKHKHHVHLLSPRNNRGYGRAAVFPVITHKAVLSHVADSNTYARAECYQDNIFDMNCVPCGENEFSMSCQCHGTGVHPYKLECIVSSAGSIVGSSCSCHIGSSNGGRCKHVIAMLLAFMKKHSPLSTTTTPSLPVVPSAKTCSEENEIGTLMRNRSLPKWVSEIVPPTEDENPPAKKKIRKADSTTNYKMNDEDLLKTAQEILEESDMAVTRSEEQQQHQPSLASLLPDEYTVNVYGGLVASHGVNKLCCHGDSPVIGEGYDDDLTQEIDQTTDEISSPEPSFGHHDNFTCEKIQSSLLHVGDVKESQQLFADSVPPTAELDKSCDNHNGPCDKHGGDGDSLLDELFGY